MQNPAHSHEYTCSPLPEPQHSSGLSHSKSARRQAAPLSPSKIPAALPYFFAGLRVSVSYAFISTVVSEWLGGFDGLGVYMIQSKKLFQYDTMFAIIVLISAISLLGMFLVDQLERTILKWKKD